MPVPKVSVFEIVDCIFTGLRRITFKFGNFTNIKALFPDVDRFSVTCACQKLKKIAERSIY